MVTKITIVDLERYFYGGYSDPRVAEFLKEAGAITSILGLGVYNPVYGAFAWAQLNQEANLFGALPKAVWERTGIRVITSRGAPLGTGGIAETDNIPGPIRPTVTVIRPSPKIVAHSFEVSEVVQLLATQSTDDVWGSVEQLRVYFAREHAEHINAMLGAKLVPGYNAGNNMESIDHVVSGYSEASIREGNQEIGSAVDIYGIDRHTAPSWADSIVNHNNGTARDLTDELIRETLQKARLMGANTNVIFTGYDTYAKIQGLYINFLRYQPMSETKVQFGVNGIMTAEGIDAGIHVASLYGIPLIPSKNIPADVISRIYFLDTTDPEGFGQPRLGIRILAPTQYFETRDPFVAGGFKVKGVYRTIGELVCARFNAQAKIRDLR